MTSRKKHTPERVVHKLTEADRLLPARKPRALPFNYSQDDLDALLAACGQVFSDERIAIGLLAATGLRIGEVLKLRVGDIDHVNYLLVINAAKSAERLVPLHPTHAARPGTP